MYFAGVDSSAWCLYRMNLKTQEISEVFKLDNNQPEIIQNLQDMMDSIFMYLINQTFLKE